MAGGTGELTGESSTLLVFNKSHLNIRLWDGNFESPPSPQSLMTWWCRYWGDSWRS